jgi:hypothetical protein
VLPSTTHEGPAVAASTVSRNSIGSHHRGGSAPQAAQASGSQPRRCRTCDRASMIAASGLPWCDRTALTMARRDVVVRPERPPAAAWSCRGATRIFVTGSPWRAHACLAGRVNDTKACSRRRFGVRHSAGPDPINLNGSIAMAA